MLGFIEWAFRVIVASFFLLLFSLLLTFIFNALMRVFHGPELTFTTVAFLVFIAAVAVGNWSFTLMPKRS